MPEEVASIALLSGLVTIVLLVLAILIPWFVFRISAHTRQTRDLLKDVKKSLHIANGHLATMADDSKEG